jgi:hypothetical protein
MGDLKGEGFHPITLEDQDWMREKLKKEHYKACEYSFASNFIWRRIYEVEVAQIAGCGVIRYRGVKGSQYSFPFGDGDKKAAVQILMEMCAQRGQKLCLSPIGDEEREQLCAWFHGQFAAHSARDSFDYIYTTEKLAFLKGRKLQKKRNHIARFKDGDDWRYEPMGAGNIDACRQMAKEWGTRREEKWSRSLGEEMSVLEEAFSHFEELSFVGGVLYKQDRVVAFTIGERVRDEMMIVHFEKAFPDVQGAYPMINQQFVQHECEGLDYINREDDTGDLGLRKAKLSYYPDILLKKYIACESEVVCADEADREAVTYLWQTCFGDDEAYIDFFFTNRFTAETMLVIHRDGRPVSMASLLPATLTVGGAGVEAYYVYAVATLPEYRGQGLASRILSYAKEKFRRPLLLQVENGSRELEGFYEKQGFFQAFQKQARQDLPLLSEGRRDGNDEGTELDGITPAIYRKLRDRHFAEEGYVAWNEQAIAYALNENQFCHGNAYLVRSGEREDILLCRPEDDGLRIIETTLSERELLQILPEVCEEMQEARCYYENGGGMLWLPEGMAPGTTEGYLNLTLG